MKLLQVNHVKKVYNTRLGARQCVALEDVGFSVDQGEFVAIMGASGSGKTTLLNIIASLDKPTSGDVCLENRPLSAIPDRELSAFRRDNLGFVFQDFNLLDTFTLRDNILLPLVLQKTAVHEMEKRLEPLARSLGLTALLDKSVGRRKAAGRCGPGRHHQSPAAAGRRADRRAGQPLKRRAAQHF